MKRLVGYKESNGKDSNGNAYGSVTLFYEHECESFERNGNKTVGSGMEVGQVVCYDCGSLKELASHVDIIGGELVIGSEFEAYYTGEGKFKKLSMIMVKGKK